MNQKKLIVGILVVLALAVIGVFIWEKQTVIEQQSNQEQPKQEITNVNDIKKVDSVESIEFSPQQIVAIPNSTNVWYEVPEMGIKLLLSKPVAEEFVYEYSGATDGFITVNPKTGNLDFSDSKRIESATFFQKKVIVFNKQCDSSKVICSSDNIEFSINKISGVYKNEILAFGSKFLKQFNGFYLITGGSRQAERFSEEEQKRFDETVAPLLPQFPRLKDIKIENL